MHKHWLKSTAFLAIIACLLWSTAFAGVKIGLQYAAPLQFAGIRFFLSGLLLLPFSGPFIQTFAVLKKHYWFILKVSLTQTFILYALFYFGVSLIPGALAAIVIGSQPLFAALTAHVMMRNDKMTLKKSLTITFGITGIVLIAIKKGFNTPEGASILFGIALLILANIASGVGNVIVSRKQKGLSAIFINSWQLTIGGLLLFLSSLIFEPKLEWLHLPTEFYLSLGWLSFLSAGAFSIWFILLQRPQVKVSDLNIWKFIIPVFGALLSWGILANEQPDFISISGMLIIGISIILYSRVRSRG
jgi:drug/metabolite transporter (DMT)-like permease